MTKEQIELAHKMSASGITWGVIASYFNVTPSTLIKYRKKYDNNNQISGANASG